MNSKSILFEDVGDDSPIWVGNFNQSVIELYDRPETGAEEIYAAPGTDNVSIEQVACDLAAFLDSAQPEDYTAQRNPEDPTAIDIYVGGEPWTSFTLEAGTGTLVVVTDIQLEDAELDYLDQNGVLPDPDKFGDQNLDLENPDDDFWDGAPGE